MVAAAACLKLKRFGEQHLNFRRLARSFPAGDPADRLSAPVRNEVEDLLHRLAVEDIAWQDRHEIRQRLKTLTEKDSRILSIYKTEIAAVCPAMLHCERQDT